jgi:hypothetical protein
MYILELLLLKSIVIDINLADVKNIRFCAAR